MTGKPKDDARPEGDIEPGEAAASRADILATLERMRRQQEVIGRAARSDAFAAGDVEQLVREITELATKTTGVERANVWLFNEDETELRCVDSYEATPERHSKGLVLTEAQYGNEFAALKSGAYVDADDPLTDPRTSGYVEGYLRPLRITSMLDALVQVSGRRLGLLCLEHVDKPHHWERDEVQFACRLADKIALSLVNRERRNAEVRHRRLFESTRDAIITLAPPHWTFAAPNPAAIRLFGAQTEEELVAFAPWDASPERQPDGRLSSEKSREMILTATREGSHSFEWTHRRMNGEEFAADVLLTRVQDGDDAILHATVRDVTESKRIEEALRASEQRYRSILNSSPDAVVITDLGGRALLVSPRTLEILGAQKHEDVLGLSIFDFLVPEDRGRASANLALRLQGSKTEPAEYRGIRLDGDRFDMEANTAVIPDALGRPSELLFTIREITARKRGEEALRASEQRYRSILNSSPDGVIITDLEGRILMVSRVALRMFAVGQLADALGRTVLDFVVHEDHDRVSSDLVLVLSGSATEMTEYQGLRADGSRFDMSANASFLRDASGNPTQVIVTLRDITTRKQAEAALAQSLREKQALIKETHHRVKNNLALIVSLMRISAGRSAEAETKAVLREMQTRVQSVILLNEALYRTEHYKSVQLSDYLSKVATQSFQALNARPRDLRLVTDLEPVEALTAQAIPCGLIVNELLTNSLKHGFPEGKSGTVSLVLRKEADEQVCLEVSDDGVGLPADFEARRASSLGIQLLSDLARQLGGRLDVGPGPAAIFRVTFKKATAQPTREIPPL